MQCDRAEPIRRRALNQMDVLATHARIGDRDAFSELHKQVLRRDDAAWWIEHKNDAVNVLAQDIELQGRTFMNIYLKASHQEGVKAVARSLL